ncbi:hypothetical protein B0H66DRAFT_536061 [Apodospora peruviana]|uniref:Uncharacterized protein n=1 Tax=Apodospora peruviana TaxID=516989 RepID=A0AAE0HYU9_9PEZI|nr:hypothetical protein B0H66DRAFT_536061 [Apodospora peruviana]
MKGTMDGAAKSVDYVAQSILPDCPHHLSTSLETHFPAPKEFWFTGRSGGLQYMTYLSDADRGILLTRPSYDIVVADNVPAPMPVKVLAKGEVKKKMSIKDYQNRIKSVSPGDVELSTKASTEARTNGATAPKPPKGNTRTDEVKPKEKSSDKKPVQEFRAEKPRVEGNGDSIRSSQQQKQAPEIPNRKRTSETERNPPPQKRPKTDVDNLRVDQSRYLRPETPRNRDRVSERPQKDTRDSLHPLVNELSTSAMDRERDNSSSPRSTIQVNGTKPHLDSGTSTPRKGEGLSKSFVPALLSPLHPSLFEGDHPDEKDRNRRKLAEKMSARPSKPDGLPPAKKAKLKIPALLSPTLPPVIEEELARLKKTPLKGDSSQRSSQTSESPSSARKTKVTVDPVEEVAPPRRPSLVVTLKLKKANAKRAKDLLTLPSKSVKNALKKERAVSVSVDDTPPPARKRPRPADEVVVESVGTKRSKITAEALGGAAKPSGLSTPLKQTATAMSRVTSSQSMVNTPGTTGLTPGTAERIRPATSSFDASAESFGAAAIKAPKLEKQPTYEWFKQRNAEYTKLGVQLKHARDRLYKSGSEDKLGVVLHFEMVLAYMVAFHALNQGRQMERKVCDVAAWESLLPHLVELQTRVSKERSGVLKALALQMHALCLEAITAAYCSLDPASATKQFAKWTQLDRKRPSIWKDAINQCGVVEDKNMRVLIGPWMKVDDGVASALEVMRKWADRYRVSWSPVILQEKAGANGTTSARG